MATDFFGEKENQKKPLNSNEQDRAFCRPETEDSFKRLNKLMTSLYTKTNSDNFPPFAPFDAKFLHELMSNHVFAEYFQTMQESSIDAESVDIDTLMKLSLEDRNIRVAALMMKSMAFVLSMMSELFKQNTKSEKQMFALLALFESSLYNIRATLSMYVNYMSDFNLPKFVELYASVISKYPLDENSNSDEKQISVDRDMFKSILDWVANSIDMIALSQVFVETVSNNLDSQHEAHDDIVKSWKKLKGADLEGNNGN